MKKLILTITLLLAVSMSCFSQTENKESLNTELSKIIVLSKEELPENMNRTEVVLFSFNILADGTINVLDMNYSSEIIKNAVMKKISQTVLKNATLSKKVHYFKVKFLKL